MQNGYTSGGHFNPHIVQDQMQYIQTLPDLPKEEEASCDEEYFGDPLLPALTDEQFMQRMQSTVTPNDGLFYDVYGNKTTEEEGGAAVRQLFEEKAANIAKSKIICDGNVI